ncbi:MAG: hypothetical protein JGK24_00300 [Microcoleus sp. PH2017_29_MFU_D_A]|uniref:hypothetical protein n=1 Tax=unclassified Microcoleus TaxID=2642155 RepID=UPI001D5D119E|nr:MULTISPECIES: hypothetical protein [unclassified Microcoleus]MCC3429899.1 hypothetical protein [Microcoleus sp. PH2017_04_SCI_O_A]MCC3502897.1 hypothetical protein [Microcoleus sp. PH2017_19_SFW_U_A]TAG57988.1 MAG: hypothetical protein EAZ28_16255 [Oscillatoriales cyanobacterium]MCC3522627.1 hypothetical protein [Microcoleus sp. PH2017_20_SFW_D_A]MCC3552174.1 hypothetical protein [Microcoleus sp. PH2017_35_SFW_U_B]
MGSGLGSDKTVVFCWKTGSGKTRLKLKYKGWWQGQKICRHHYPIKNNCATDRDRHSCWALNHRLATPNLRQPRSNN